MPSITTFRRLWHRLRHRRAPRFVRGQRVRITAGQYQGCEGTVMFISGMSPNAVVNFGSFKSDYVSVYDMEWIDAAA